MSTSPSARSDIENLIDESHQIEHIMSKLQSDEETNSQTFREAQAQYQSWYTRALRHLPNASRDQFVDMYEGGMFIKRIKSFIFNPRAINDYYDASQDSGIIKKWKHPYETTFQESFHTQRSILQSLIYAVADVTTTLRDLAEIFARFPDFLQVFQRSRNPNIPPPSIDNESDLQVLVHACLRLFYDDVRPEDFVPEYAGGRSRVDFLLPGAGVVIETKMTRDTLNDKKVGEELLVDWGRYSKHPDCRGIFAFVYDPHRHLQNPSGLQTDLTQEQSNPATRVLVVR